jgi:hypothetical protein
MKQNIFSRQEKHFRIATNKKFNYFCNLVFILKNS